MAIIGIFDHTKKIDLCSQETACLINNTIKTEEPFSHYTHNDISIFFFGQLFDVDNAPKHIYSIFSSDNLSKLSTLDGHYLFFIFTNDKTYIVRDRHGAGFQLYYSSDFFATSLLDLHHFKTFKTEPNLSGIQHFLKYGFIKAPETALKNIQKIPAGYVLVIDNKGKQKLINIYPPTDFAQNFVDDNEEEATQYFEALHKDAIKKRIGNSTQVNLLLSGGYDSGGNISALRDVYGGKATTFSIGFKNNPWSELPLAKLMSRIYDTTHYEYEIDGHEIDDLPSIVAYLGDPFNESGMMVNYAVMKLMNQHNETGITLGGDGNDQHFGTAGHELAMAHKYKKNGISILQKIVHSVSSLPPFEKDNILFKIRFFNDKTLHILEPDNFGFRNNLLQKLMPSPLVVPASASFIDFGNDTFDDLFFKHNYYVDIQQVINEQILFKASKLSTFFNINLTFPYMSTPLYNYLKTLPRHLKVKGTVSELAKGNGISKFLHKNYLKEKLPKEITQRKKQGGFAPLLIFFTDKEKTKIYCDYILQSNLTKQLFNTNYLAQLLTQLQHDIQGDGYWFWFKQIRAFQLFNLLTLTVWWDINIEKKQVGRLNDLLPKSI